MVGRNFGFILDWMLYSLALNIMNINIKPRQLSKTKFEF